jgi:ABC-type glycerol-3-phosphate transport system permease component
MAATLLIILPMLIVYLFIQKLFIQGIDQSGLAGGEQ